MNEEITMASMTHAVVETAVSAKAHVDESDLQDCYGLANDFLVVLEESGLIVIDEAMSDLEKIIRGMYAANLYLATCAKIGKTETERLKNAETLERSLRIS